ncbi:MAG: family 78 glycoside hydrolase catalytic domain, partial [Clostridia bacterium]|nr:family 78 glycoside hydrolase catalytic domain [Clostridia bacterium]
MEHVFEGKWITTGEFAAIRPKNVFHRQLEKAPEPPDTEHLNRHILFRKSFFLPEKPGKAVAYLAADDRYKLWINGVFAGEGPAPSYHFRFGYNAIDVTALLRPGENLVAVHTLYQGLVNRVWQSGDLRHGLILDLETDGRVPVRSDESFLAAYHTGFRATGKTGYDTQFLEEYDSRAPEVGFEKPGFDDRGWARAVIRREDDHRLVPQKSHMLVFEEIAPEKTQREPGLLRVDFGGMYVGYLVLTARGKGGERVTVRCGQETREDGSVRFDLRANCRYEEDWILGEGESTLDWFDYKAFRYAEILTPEGVEITGVSLRARHYPFRLKTELKPEYRGDENLEKIWALSIRSQRYGVQEVIQDCMEREKGFYLGDGCYTALTNMILTGDDAMVRKMIDDAFETRFITRTLVTCLDCSLMQEIAEYPLMLAELVLWHANASGDLAYLEENFLKTAALLDAYRDEYEKDGLLRDLDKWCVVEWPKNFQHGYDVDIREGKVCHPAHVALNAYYIAAVRAANR